MAAVEATEDTTIVGASVEHTLVGAVEVSVDNTVVGAVEVSMEHTEVVGGGGKEAPLRRGRGKTGRDPVPTSLPSPGNLEAGAADAAAAAALAAWKAAALCLFLAIFAGPRRLAPWWGGAGG